MPHDAEEGMAEYMLIDQAIDYIEAFGLDKFYEAIAKALHHTKPKAKAA